MKRHYFLGVAFRRCYITAQYSVSLDRPPCSDLIYSKGAFMNSSSSSSNRSHHPAHTECPRIPISAPSRLKLWALPLFLLLGVESARAAPEAPARTTGLDKCAIVEAYASPGGAVLRFHDTAVWRFRDSLGNKGHVYGREVTRYSREPDGPDFPGESSLTVQPGAQLSLSEHHVGCTILVGTDDGRMVLKIHRGYSLPGGLSGMDEFVVPLQERL